MFMTWNVTGGTLATKTIACVEGDDSTLTMEWRHTDEDGVVTVTGARFLRDGNLLAAWRGQPHGHAVRLKVLPPVTLEELRDNAATGLASAGASLEEGPQPTVHTEDAVAVHVPAGTFACTCRTIGAGILTIRSWKTSDALPLSNLVEIKMDTPFALVTHEVLAAYGWQGAEPLLPEPYNATGVAK